MAIGLQSDHLEKQLEAAIGGDRDPLYKHLARLSGLPGTRPNLPFAERFGEVVASHGKAADGLVVALVSLDENEAPGASAWEFLPVCGVYALAARAAKDDKAYRKSLARLHSLADDARFRVRDAVVAALVHLGTMCKVQLLDDVQPWMDGYHHAAAVILAIASEPLIHVLDGYASVEARLEEAFVLLENAPRSAARYPGHKHLVEAMSNTPRIVAARFGVPAFDQLARWTRTDDPDLRAIIRANLTGTRLVGRYASEIERVKAALAKTAPPVRNPDHNFGPHRSRGKKR
jgi:hypothetical protein